jgi:hypothetical protein
MPMNALQSLKGFSHRAAERSFLSAFDYVCVYVADELRNASIFAFCLFAFAHTPPHLSLFTV